MAFLEVYWSMMKSRMNCALTDQFIGMKVNIIYWSIMSREFVQNSSGICIPDINKPKRINTVKSNKYSNVLCHTGKVPQLLAYLTYFRSFTRTADYPHRLIIAYGKKKSQQITRSGG